MWWACAPSQALPATVLSAANTAPPRRSPYIRAVRFSPDGKLFATGVEDKIRIWDIATKCTQTVFEGHQQEIRSLDVSRNGRFIVSGSGDKTVRIWFTVDEPDIIDAGVAFVCISPDGRLVAVGSLETVVRGWDVQTGQLVERLEAPATAYGASRSRPTARACTSQFAGAQSGAAAADTAPAAASGTPPGAGQATPNMAPSQTPVTPESERVGGPAPGLADALDPGAVPPELKKEGSDWFAVFAGRDKKGAPEKERALDVGLVHTLMHESVVCCVRFSADGKYLATGCNRTAQIYDTKTGMKTCVLVDESASKIGDLYIRSVCFSPDGKFLATGAEDKQIR
ncbi:WD40 repeat-like protein, partial [Obba rivulosa]